MIPTTVIRDFPAVDSPERERPTCHGCFCEQISFLSHRHESALTYIKAVKAHYEEES